MSSGEQQGARQELGEAEVAEEASAQAVAGDLKEVVGKALDQTAGADGDESDSEPEGGAFDYAGLQEAQRAAAVGAVLTGASGSAPAAKSDRKRQRGGDKDTKKRKKRQKREDDLLRAKKAGLHVPSLKEALEAVAAAAKAKAVAAAVAPPASTATPAASPFIPSAEPPTSSTAPVDPAPSPVQVASSTSEPPALAAARSAARAMTAQGHLLRTMHSYADAVDATPATSSTKVPGTTASSTTAPGSGSGAAGSTDSVSQGSAGAAVMARVAREAVRRARIVEVLSEQSVFVTNVGFKATEQELRDWLGKCGNIRSMKLGKDKANGKFLGYAHVTFENQAVAKAAIEQCDRHELYDREMRVTSVKKDEKFIFDLPKEIEEDIKNLLREAYEGKNLSTIKDAWQKRHEGKKLVTTRWGFKNFSSALKTIPGITIETHADKLLTNLAFFEGSPVHTAFLEAKARTIKEKAAKAEEEAKRKREEEANGTAEGGPSPKAARTEPSKGSAPDEAGCGISASDEPQAGAAASTSSEVPAPLSAAVGAAPVQGESGAAASPAPEGSAGEGPAAAPMESSGGVAAPAQEKDPGSTATPDAATAAG